MNYNISMQFPCYEWWACLFYVVSNSQNDCSPRHCELPWFLHKLQTAMTCHNVKEIEKSLIVLVSVRQVWQMITWKDTAFTCSRTTKVHRRKIAWHYRAGLILDEAVNYNGVIHMLKCLFVTWQNVVFNVWSVVCDGSALYKSSVGLYLPSNGEKPLGPPAGGMSTNSFHCQATEKYYNVGIVLLTHWCGNADIASNKMKVIHKILKRY